MGGYSANVQCRRLLRPLCDLNSMNKADGGLTYHIPVPSKRSRDSFAKLNALPVPQKNKLSSPSSPFLDQQLLHYFHTQQSEIDRFIAQHVDGRRGCSFFRWHDGEVSEQDRKIIRAFLRENDVMKNLEKLLVAGLVVSWFLIFILVAGIVMKGVRLC